MVNFFSLEKGKNGFIQFLILYAAGFFIPAAYENRKAGEPRLFTLSSLYEFALALGAGYLDPAFPLGHPYPLAAHGAAEDLEHIVVIYDAASLFAGRMLFENVLIAALKKALHLKLGIQEDLVFPSSFGNVPGEHPEVRIDYKDYAKNVEDRAPAEENI